MRNRAASPEPVHQGYNREDHRGARPRSQRATWGSSGHSQQVMPSGFDTGDIAQLHLPNLKVIVVKGDITKETTDAIVNSTGDDLNFRKFDEVNSIKSHK